MGGIPVRTSNGTPKRLSYPLVYALPVTFPEWRFVAAAKKGTLDAAGFSSRYRTQLNSIGVEEIREKAEGIRAAAVNTLPGVTAESPLVLLCFDVLKGPDAFCHRRMFAEFWESETGEEVPELGRVYKPEIRSQEELF